MAHPRKSSETSHLRNGRLLVCLLLAVLSLYNPYLAATGGSAGLSFCHAASYRATVGASELQHFSPTNNRDFLATPLLATLDTFLDRIEFHTEPQAWPVAPVLAPPLLLLPSSLWFRPPPTI